jgi:hypothetical protein
VDRESLLKGMGAKADLPAPETSRLQSDYKDPSSKTPQGAIDRDGDLDHAFATAIGGRFHGKEEVIGSIPIRSTN